MKYTVDLYRRGRIDYVLLCCILFLSAIGPVFIYSAGSYSAELQTGDAFFFAKKQLLALIPGTVFCLLLSRFNVLKLKKYAFPILLLSYALLALVFVPGLGMEYYGAKRWLNLGFFSLQPSEISKFGLVIFLSALNCKFNVKKPKGFFLSLLSGGLMAVLIMLEPNMSITMCVLAVNVGMLFIGGAKLKYFAALSLPALALVVLLIASEPYRLQRIVAFMDPFANPKGEGYQLIQSYYSLGSGGLFGVGLFNSRQKLLFLPFSESDFILSIIGEELGYFGIISILSVYALLIYRGLLTACRATDAFSAYLAGGITLVIAVQTLLNVAVVSGSIPPTGLPLPFISSGGSSLVSFMSAGGLLLSIGRSTRSL